MEHPDRLAFDLMLFELHRLDLWLQRTDAADGIGFSVASASELHSDDSALSPYELSHAAWDALVHAVDHLHLVRTAVATGEIAYLFAPYSLLRAAIENAATAVWLLVPDAPTERITRRLRKAAANVRDSDKLMKLIGEPGPRSETERLEEIWGIAHEQGIARGAAGATVGFGDIVKTAGAEVDTGAVTTQALWQVGSAVAHGDQWATLTVPNREELPGAPDGMANLRLTPGMNALAMMVLVASELIAKGWELFDRRRQ